MKFTHKDKQPVDFTILEMAKAKKNSDPESTVAPEFIPSKHSLDKTITLFEQIFINMQNKVDVEGKNKSGHSGLLLSSDPGTGKTSRINLFAKMMGLNLILIEAPHIVEEHIINIPFIIFDTQKDTESKDNMQIKDITKYNIVPADSNLYRRLERESHNKRSDQQLLHDIYAPDKNGDQDHELIEIYEALGGTKDKLPATMAKARKNTSVILFIDEYFRQSNKQIINALRNILQNELGTHRIPDYVFIITASNMKDEGLSAIPDFSQFDEYTELEGVSKDEWFSWIVFKYAGKHDAKNVKLLNKKVIDKFYHILEEEHLSYKDFETAVRTSPRRWEQLMLYLSASLPREKRETAKDAKDFHADEHSKFTQETAKNILTNVKVNFRNYKAKDASKEYSLLAEPVLKAVAELIKENTGIEIGVNETNDKHEWNKTLMHQIEIKEKLGNKRKYVPIISGLPGIGKTSKIMKIAKELDLRLIYVNVATTNADEATGQPLPRKDENGNLGVEFSRPLLYHKIMKKIKEQDAEYTANMSAEEKKEYAKRPYKYLVFLDELNRNSPAVFNTMRKVLLEKDFGSEDPDSKKELKLPEEAIMVGAINPFGAGTQALTSHMQDVLDIIPSTINWTQTIEYLSKFKQHSPLQDIDNPVAYEVALDVVKKFAEKYESKDTNIPIGERPYHLDYDPKLYLNAREYTSMFENLVRDIDNTYTRFKQLDFNSMTEAEMKSLEKQLRSKIFLQIKTSVNHSISKAKVNGTTLLEDIKRWIMTTTSIEFGENLFYYKTYNTKKTSLVDILTDSFTGAEKTPLMLNQNFDNFMKNVVINQFREEMTKVILHHIKNQKDINEYIIDTSHQGLRLDIDKFKEYEKTGRGEDKIYFYESNTVSRLNNFFRDVILSCYVLKISAEKMNTDIIMEIIYSIYDYFEQNTDNTNVDNDTLQQAMTNLSDIIGNFAKVISEDTNDTY